MSNNMLPHFLNLLGRSWHAMTAATSTNTLGFILWTVALTVVGWAATVAERWWQLRQENTDLAFRKALVNSLWPGVFLAGGVGGLVLIVLGIFMVRTVYDDHNLLVQQANELRKGIPARDAEIQRLKEKLTETCFQPDRRITEEQHDLLYRPLRDLARKTRDKRLAIGFTHGDLESARFTGAVYSLLKNSGWDMSDPFTMEMPMKPGDRQPPGFLGGLSVTIEMDESTIEGKERRQVAIGISQAFADAKTPMMQFPVGGSGNSPRPKRVTIWVGPKAAN